MATCTATKTNGRPCTFGSRPSGLCHVHDPAVQCGGRKKNGDICRSATGGGRCPVHADQQSDEDQTALFPDPYATLRAEALHSISVDLDIPATLLEGPPRRASHDHPLSSEEVRARAARTELEAALLDYGVVPMGS